MNLGVEDQSSLLKIYKEALSIADMGVWRWRIQADILTWDSGIRKLYDLDSAEEILKIKDWYSKIYYKDQKKAEELVHEAINSDLEVNHLLRIQSGSGKMKYTRTKAKKIKDTNGKVIELIGVNWDVTIEVQKIKENDLFEKNFKLMLSLVDKSEDVFGFTDVTGIPLYVNKTGREKYGIELVPKGKYFSEYLVESDQKMINLNVVPLLRLGKNWEGEVRILDRYKSEIIPLWLRIFCVKVNKNKNDIFYCCLASNLTKMKSIQNTLLQQSKLAVLGEVTSGIAHEVNNPLSIIVGKANLIEQNLNQFDHRKISADIISIQKNADRIAKIIKSLNSFSRNSIHDPYEKVSLLKIVDDAFEIMKEKFKFELIDFTIVIDEKMTYENKIDVRESEILQVLINLLTNSYDAVQPLQHKWVKLTITEKSTVYDISVMDSGSGIHSEIIPHMMEPFYTTKNLGSGTGLGLSLSLQIIKSHGGTLDYNSKSVNTEFVISLKK